MLRQRPHIPKKSVALFGTKTPGSVYYRLGKVGDELKRRGWEVYQPFIAGTEQLTEQEKWTEGWQNKTDNMDVSYSLEQMIRHSYFTVCQFLDNRHASIWLEAMKNTTRVPILCDIDDDIFHVDAWNRGVATNRYGAGYQFIAKEQMDLADGILCSTEALVDAVRRETTNQNFFIVPNGLEPAWRQIASTPTMTLTKGQTLKIGWQGAQAHTENLRLIKNVIFTILQRFPHVEFSFFGNNLPDWIHEAHHPRIQYEDTWVPYLEYPKKIASLGWDITVAPLQDTYFNRGKTNLRWMEYSALKIPSVVSRVRAYECVRHDVDGLIAQDEEEWETALSTLIQSETKRRAIGEQAYERVWRDFHIGVAADIYESIYRKYLPRNRHLNQLTQERFQQYRKTLKEKSHALH